MSVSIIDERALAEEIIERADKARISIQGGYPSAHCFANVDGDEGIAWATVDHDGAPTLCVTSLSQFIETHSFWLDCEAP